MSARLEPGPFYVCTCTHKVYDHGRRKVPNAGIEESTGCRVDGCPCTKYQAQDGSTWPTGSAAGGAPSEAVDQAADLDLDTVHWIDGRVYLTDDEPPL